jgi:hypothetical protein
MYNSVLTTGVEGPANRSGHRLQVVIQAAIKGTVFKTYERTVVQLTR